ncbi:protein-tyrosine phosphatase-like protein [Radiomyces spectabilis]|uniref:protein-tyrosine phosphatase-like protein n=1 Tax=Radiomyces spectabilis TaxID=64574 RepID=UPI00221FA17F|nr:protein-tyrosine phosphatase-like protein [Radiomyces spectabilis]KAI8371657.1 protein-tyrosine phosphatase-like protein [Radiomyces spectabilis]
MIQSFFPFFLFLLFSPLIEPAFFNLLCVVMISVIKAPITDQKFLILDAPTSDTLPKYIDVLRKENVAHLVRICHRQTHDGRTHEYDADDLHKETGIQVIDDIKFEDGGVPSPEAVQRWLHLAEDARRHGTTLGVHCVAGIGRAPVMVTLSLVESGMDPLDAILYIRQHRRGALNKTQLRFIEAYNARSSRRKSWLGWLRKTTKAKRKREEKKI